MYRRYRWNKPQTLSDKCSNPDSSGYIDDSTLRVSLNAFVIGWHSWKQHFKRKASYEKMLYSWVLLLWRFSSTNLYYMNPTLRNQPCWIYDLQRRKLYLRLLPFEFACRICEVRKFKRSGNQRNDRFHGIKTFRTRALNEH